MRARRLAIVALAVMAAYAAPYLAGFGYERHFSIFVMMAALFNLPLCSEFLRLRTLAAAARIGQPEGDAANAEASPA